MSQTVPFESLKGKTFEKVTEDGYGVTLENKLERFELRHDQECCEAVYIEDIAGELDDLVDSPILLAEETSDHGDQGQGSETWTFYKLSTIKGSVTIRFYGTSNGFYSETADLYRYEKSILSDGDEV